MGLDTLSRKTRLMVTITIAVTFFIVEISIGFKTGSLALIADAFHYMSDILGFIMAFVAVLVGDSQKSPSVLSFGWARASLLGGFANGAFLVALGVSIILQSIERFIFLERVEDPKLVLIVGCIGLTLNIISAAFLHEHDHSHSHDEGPRSDEKGRPQDEAAATEYREPFRGEAISNPNARHHSGHSHKTTNKKSNRDLNMLGVLIHVLGDAANNIGVIISALVIWLAKYEGRFYADPGVSLGIGIFIIVSAVPLVKRSGTILLQSIPPDFDMADVKKDLEMIQGFRSLHELHIWRLDQRRTVATGHVVVDDDSLQNFIANAKIAAECLHAYGIHSVTLQPEISHSVDTLGDTVSFTPSQSTENSAECKLKCGTTCDSLVCCN